MRQFLCLATHNREAAKKYSRLVGYIARGIEYKSKKKGNFVTGAALPRVSFELVITEYPVDNIMSFEKEQF